VTRLGKVTVPDLGPSEDDEHAGCGIDPELIALEIVSLENFRGLATYLRKGGKVTPEVRDFLAERVALGSVSEYLRRGGGGTPPHRSILVEMCEKQKNFIRLRRGPNRQKQVFDEDLRRALQVAELMLNEGLKMSAACTRLAERRRDASMEVFRDAFKKFRETEWIQGILAHPGGPPSLEELERENQLIGLTLDLRGFYDDEHGA